MAASYAESAEKDLTCPVCWRLFTDPNIPKILDCSHVCCQLCLTTILNESTISCPECRRKTRVKNKDVMTLRTNLRLRSLAENHKRHTQLKHQVPQQVMKAIAKKADGVPSCSEHEDEKLHFYCLTCNVTACQACVLLNHDKPKHIIKGVKDVHREKLKIMEATVQRNERRVLELKKELQHTAHHEQKIQANIIQCEQEIDRAFEMLINKAKKEAQHLKEHLRSDTSTESKEQQEKLSKKVHKLQVTIRDAKQVMAEASSHKYLSQHAALVKKFISMETPKSKALPSSALYVPVYGFNEKTLFNLGMVNKVKARKLILCSQLDGFDNTVSGIAVGPDDTLAVCMYDGKQVSIFKKQPNGQYVRHFSLKPTQKDWYPFDVAAMENGDFGVARCNCVDIYSQSGKYKKTLNTSRYASDETIIDVVATPAGHIITGDNHTRCLLVYSSLDGYRIDHINTIYPLRISIGEFEANSRTRILILVSDLEHCVQVLHVELTSDDSAIVIEKELKIHIANATALCYDEKTECLLVGRKDAEQDAEDGGVIEQYCIKSGGFVACLVEGLKDPQAMAFTDDGMLAVADDKTIKFYEITTETV